MIENPAEWWTCGAKEKKLVALVPAERKPEGQPKEPLRSPFDLIRHVDERGREYWLASELAVLLECGPLRFLNDGIRPAKELCEAAGLEVCEHISHVIIDGSEDIRLSLRGAHLVVLSGDNRSPGIAKAKRYFSDQTRRAELGLSLDGRRPVSPPSLVRSWSERLSGSLTDHRREVLERFGSGPWTTVIATTAEILTMEDALVSCGIPLRPGDLPDGSIGQRWSSYRQKQGLPHPLGRAPLHLPDRDIVAYPWVYLPDQRKHFEKWFNEVYVPEHLPHYFAGKKEWNEYQLPAAQAAGDVCLRLTGKPATLSRPLLSVEKKSPLVPQRSGPQTGEVLP
jgi:hypothetical protein